MSVPAATTKVTQPNRDVHRQPSIEDVEDLDEAQRHRAVPKKASRVIELADGSEDNMDSEDKDKNSDDKDKSKEADSESDEEVPAESTEAELSTRTCKRYY
jgi:hypothetical protein